MNRRFAFLVGCTIIVLMVIGSAPIAVGALPDKTKKPIPTHQVKTKPPPHPTKRNPTDEPTKAPPPTKLPPTEAPAPTSAPPTQAPAQTSVPPTQAPAPTSVPSTQPPAPTSVPPTEAPAPTNPAPTAAPTLVPTETTVPIPVPTETIEPTRTPGRGPGEERPSPMPTSVDTQMPTYMAIGTETALPADTVEPQSSAAQTPIDTSLPQTPSTPPITPSIDRTSTPTITPTAVRTLAALVVPTPFASTIETNELLARPQGTDWNGDGVVDAGDEWIELYNSGPSWVDLSGWRLSANDGASDTTFTFPPGSMIAGKSYRVFYGNQTKILLNRSGGELRLIYPNGRIADIVRYPELAPDQSFERSSDRGNNWSIGCLPSPHAPNCSSGATLTSTFNLSYFEKHIADASLIARIDQGVLATNALLAILLALITGFCSNLLNAAMASHTAQVQKIGEPLNELSKSFRQAGIRPSARTLSRSLFWVGTPIKLAALFLACGFVLGFLDPGLDLSELDGWLLVLALTFSLGVVAAGVLAAQRLVLRRYGSEDERRARGGSINLVLGTTILSRFVGFIPGIQIAAPTGFDVRQESNMKTRLSLVAIGAMVFVGLAAWVVAPFLETDAWLKTVALLVFAVAVQTLFVEMLPFNRLHGRALFESSRPVWFLLFALISLFLLETMLNPDGTSIGAFQSPTMIILAVLVVGFSITSAILSLYLNMGEARQ